MTLYFFDSNGKLWPFIRDRVTNLIQNYVDSTDIVNVIDLSEHINYTNTCAMFNMYIIYHLIDHMEMPSIINKLISVHDINSEMLREFESRLHVGTISN